MTIDYVKQRQAFGKAIIEFQNTQFVLAECKTEATIAKVFLDHCMDGTLTGKLDTVDRLDGEILDHRPARKDLIDRCLQLFGGYGYMDEYPISRLYRDARVLRIYAGTNEIMKLLIARSLWSAAPGENAENGRRLHLRPRAHARAGAAKPTARCTRSPRSISPPRRSARSAIATSSIPRLRR